MSKPAPLSCVTCEGKARNEWCTLRDDELARLDLARTHATVAPGEPVFEQGAPCEAIHCVEAGLVALRRRDGRGGGPPRGLIVGLAHANETLGYAALFSGRRHQVTAEALVETRVCTIARGTLEALIADNPGLAGRFLRRLARDVDASEQERLDAIALPARARLAQLLLELADRYGRLGASGALELELPLARRDLADLLGIRAESLARAVRALSDAGRCAFAGRLVTIPSVEHLAVELTAGG